MMDEVWLRTERVLVYLSGRRARYASITRAQDGRLLILFTHQTKAQEEAGRGDLLLSRRTRTGDWWQCPVPVHESVDALPQAIGTLTTLDCGRLVAPFLAAGPSPEASRVRILESTDDGDTWSASSPICMAPLCWGAPYGRLLEQNGTLLMPVYGAMTQADLAGTRLACGLLRSADAGRTWGDFSTIAGPDPDAAVSYEFPAVTALADGTLLAVLTARRLQARPELPLDVPQELMRATSTDGGRTWTGPDPLAVGSWASLTRMDDDTVACCFAVWAGWGVMQVMWSNDGFRTIRHRLPGSGFVRHGWLPGHAPSEWGTGWARDPVPPPPVVPNLAGDWSAGHYGFSSGLALDGDHLMVAIGQRQREGDTNKEPAIEEERVETITVERTAGTGPSGPAGRHGEPSARWRLAERWTVAEWREKTNQTAISSALEEPGLALSSGGGVRITSEELIPGWYDHWQARAFGREKGYTLESGGYPSVGRKLGGRSVSRLHFEYTADSGCTWLRAALEEPGPLRAAAWPGGPLFEEPDGTIVAAAYGYQTGEDLAVHLYTCCLVRSHDGGQTWGDWSIIAYDSERGCNYSETALVRVPDGTWVVFVRSECINSVPASLLIKRTVSTDRGRTWSEPEPCAAAGVYGGLLLPDGGIATAGQNTGNWGVTISYDYGRTWVCVLPATYAPCEMGVLDDTAFWVYDHHGGIVSIYRR